MLKYDGVMPSESGEKTYFQPRILGSDKLSFKCAHRTNTFPERKWFNYLSCTLSQEPTTGRCVLTKQIMNQENRRYGILEIGSSTQERDESRPTVSL